MKSRAGTIVGWIATILAALFFTFTAVMKFIPIEAGSQAEEFMRRLGTSGIEPQLGILQIIILVLWLVPRTSTIGLVLMVGYLGGALATNITHGFTMLEAAPIHVLFLLLIISAWIRNPELKMRLMGKLVVS